MRTQVTQRDETSASLDDALNDSWNTTEYYGDLSPFAVHPFVASDHSVLLIDDDEEQLFLFDTLLTTAGFRVNAFHSAKEGLEMMSRRYFDIVVVDLKMPEISGLDFVKEVRSIRTFPHYMRIPIIILTACTSDMEFPALKVGADMFCQKSNAKKHLIKQIQFLLEA